MGGGESKAGNRMELVGEVRRVSRGNVPQLELPDGGGEEGEGKTEGWCDVNIEFAEEGYQMTKV